MDFHLFDFARMRARCSTAKLLLVGDGRERTDLQLRAQGLGLNGSVRFLGIREDIPELIATCDLMVLASHQEGLPMVVLEAMAAGKPVIATRVGALPEVVRHQQTGLIVPPGDAERLAEALLALSMDSVQRRRLGGQGLALVQDQYSFKRSLDQYEALYRSVLSGATGVTTRAVPINPSFPPRSPAAPGGK